MAPGRPVISVGIQPQIALYSVILGSVCAFGWYSEKYWRDEGDLDGHIKKLYLQDAQDAQVKMPQMAAAIRGQTMDLDGRMDKMVWGGKAQLLTNTTNGGISSSSIGSGGSNNNDETPEGSSSLAGHVDDTDDSNTTTTIEEENEEKQRRRRRKKRKRKKKAGDQDDEATAIARRKEEEEQAQQALLEQQKQKLILQSSIAGIAVGAVTVAAVSALMGGSGGRK